MLMMDYSIMIQSAHHQKHNESLLWHAHAAFINFNILFRQNPDCSWFASSVLCTITIVFNIVKVSYCLLFRACAFSPVVTALYILKEKRSKERITFTRIYCLKHKPISAHKKPNQTHPVKYRM